MNRLLRIALAALLLSASTGCFWKESSPPPVVKPPAKVALVLGAGASRGFAHIGVLKILEGNRVPIHMIVGRAINPAHQSPDVPSVLALKSQLVDELIRHLRKQKKKVTVEYH